MNPVIEPISFLIGKWVGCDGLCQYPTMEPLKYDEILEINHPEKTQPILHLKYQSWRTDPVTGDRKYLHFESGYLKVKPNSDPLFLTYTSAHNNGNSIIEEGNYDPKTKTLTLESTKLARTSLNKPTGTIKVKRVITLLEENKLSQKFFMATTTNPNLDEHLFIVYNK